MIVDRAARGGQVHAAKVADNSNNSTTDTQGGTTYATDRSQLQSSSAASGSEEEQVISYCTFARCERWYSAGR